MEGSEAEGTPEKRLVCFAARRRFKNEQAYNSTGCHISFPYVDV